MEGENRLYTVLAVAGGLLCLAAALFFQSAPAAALGALFFLLTLAVWKYGYALFPMLMENAKVVEAGIGYEIPPSQDAIVGTSGGRFFATAFLSARLHETEGGAAGLAKQEAGRMFERVISSSGFPFRVCCLVCPLDLKGELEEMRTKRSIAESRRASLKTHGKKDPEAARLDREIAMWGRQISHLTSGQQPLEAVFYLSTTGSGITREEALALASTQSEELSVVAGNALSCEVTRVRGEEMKRLFSWEFFAPSDLEELRDQMF